MAEEMEAGELVVDGARVPVHGFGPAHGRRLVLLHGGFSDPVGDFGMFAGKLDQRLSVTAPVLRGHAGRGVAPGQTVGPVGVADDVAALVRSQGWERPVIGGYSLGGRGAMIAAQRGLDVAALVLLAPRFRAFREAEYLDHERGALEVWPDWRDPSRTPMLAAMRAGIIAVDIALEPWAEAIGDLPVLILRGEHDRLVPRAEFDTLLPLAPSVRYVEIPGRGHRLQDKATDEIAGHINAFLAEVPD